MRVNGTLYILLKSVYITLIKVCSFHLIIMFLAFYYRKPNITSQQNTTMTK